MNPVERSALSTEEALFIEAWTWWDDAPREDVRAIRFCDATIALGDRLGMSHMAVRRVLTAERRAGSSYQEAYRVLMGKASS